MGVAAKIEIEELYAPVMSSNPSHPQGWPIRIIVSSQTEARHNRMEWSPSHLVSIRAPGSKLLSMIDLPPERHLELQFSDALFADEPQAATLDSIERAFAFIDTLPEDARLLVHCLRGIGRSTALTLGILARYMDAEQAAATLHALRPDAKPNRHVATLCDTALGLKGKLARQTLRFPAKTWKAAKA